MRRLRVLFSPFGSEGDVNPLIWIAEGMAARGHDVVFIITPHYQRLIDGRGFTAVPIGTEEQFLAFARNPKAWDPRNGPRTVIRGMVDTIPEAVAAFERAGDKFDLAILSTLGVAIGSLAEARGIPRIMVHMQPICVRSVYDFPLVMSEMGFLQHTPLWFKRAFFWLVDRLVWAVAERPLNRLRTHLGLPAWRNFYQEGLHGGIGGIAMFPDWFASPQPDWPPEVRTFNFPVTPQPGSYLRSWTISCPAASLRSSGLTDRPILISSTSSVALCELPMRLDCAACWSASIPERSPAAGRVSFPTCPV